MSPQVFECITVSHVSDELNDFAICGGKKNPCSISERTYSFFTSGRPPYLLSSVRYQCDFNSLMLNETFTVLGSPGLVLLICFLINCPF